MKILAVTPWVPTTRRPRSRGLLKMLAERHEVHLICMAWSDEEAAEAAAIDFLEVEVIRGSRVGGLLGTLRAFLRGTSLQQGYVSSRALRDAITQRAQVLQPDACYFNVIRSAHLVGVLEGQPMLRVLDMDEVRSDYYRLLAKTSRSVFWQMVSRLEASRMQRAERAASTSFDVLLMSSPLDVDKAAGSHLVRSPLAEPLIESTTQDSETVKRNDVVFVGRLSYYANVEAIVWFVQNVWPLVLSVKPDATLTIVGESAGKSITDLASASVTVTGRVPAIAPYYRDARVSIVPVQFATGAQMKLIESMSTRTPAIVTPIVRDGIGIVEGTHCLVADRDPIAWADQVLLALGDDAATAELGRRAFDWAVENYSDETISNALHQALAATGTERWAST